MGNTALEKLAWLLIYSGLLLVALGLFLMRSDTTVGWIIVAAGGVDATVGALLIWVRSRRRP